MSNITRHAIRVYSALSALKGQGGDVLDALIPFFDPILKIMDGKIFDPKLVVSGAKKMYHWRITREIVEQLIPRLSHLNLLEKHGTGSSSTYIVTYRDVIKDDNTVDISKIFDEIIHEFQKFPPLVTDLFAYAKSREELADILIRFLVNSNVLFQSSGSLPNEIVAEVGDLGKLPEGGRPLTEPDRYMAARFVQHLLKNRVDLVPSLSKFASIGLLTEVIDDFVRPTVPAERTDTTIVVDAPLALDYLGLSGKDIQADIKSVLDTLSSIGCRIVVFPVTCGEMSQNLKALLENSPPDRHGYTHSAMIAGEVLADYVLAVANNPEKALAAQGIEVKDINLVQFPASHKHFTREMHEDFMSAIPWGKDVAAKEHDADCLALLMRLRDGKHSSDLFKCNYVFVTRNVQFTRRSREYCVQSRLIFPNQEGPVIHQRELATLTWLRTGLGASEAIPRSHLVAHCNRILQVRPELTEAMKDKLRSFSHEKLDQYELLLLDHRSVRKLADETLNDEKLVTGENAQELLDLMRAATADEVRKEFESKLAGEKRKHNQAQRTAAAKHLGDLSEKEDELQRLRHEFDRVDRENTNQSRDKERAVDTMLAAVNHYTKIVGRSATTLMVGLGLLFIVNIAGGFIPETNAVWNWSLRILGAIGIYETVAGILHWPQWGLTHLLDWNARRKLRKEIKTRALNWVKIESFQIDKGEVTRGPITIEHDRNEYATPVTTQSSRK